MDRPSAAPLSFTPNCRLLGLVHRSLDDCGQPVAMALSSAQPGALDTGHLLDQLADAVVVAGADMNVRYVNAAAASMLGWSADEIVGRGLEQLVPERLRAAHVAGFTRFVATGERHLIGGRAVTVTALRRDGTEIDVELTLGATGAAPRVHSQTPGSQTPGSQTPGSQTPDSQTPDSQTPDQLGGEVLVVATLRDVSDRVELERRLAITPYLQAGIQVAHVLQRAHAMDEGLEGVLPALCQRLDWDVATLWLTSPQDLTMECIDVWTASRSPYADFAESIRGRRTPVEDGLPGEVAALRLPLLLPDLAAVTNTRREPAERAGLKTGVAFPILAGEAALGAIELFGGERRHLDEALVDVLGGIGRQLGQFVVRMQAEQERTSLVTTLQRSLLPPHLPHPDGLEVAAAYRAGGMGGDIGGDFYDVFAVDAVTWDVVIGDVCGKGPEAATVTALARYAIRGAAPTAGGPAAVLRMLNSVLSRGEPESRFLTAAYARLRREGDVFTVTLCCAGHPLPVLIDAAGGCRFVGTPGSLLGVLDDPDLSEVRLELAAGESLVLYTDGVVEARARGGGEFGDARLLGLLSAVYNRALADIPRLIEAAADVFDGAERDDLAVVAVRAGSVLVPPDEAPGEHQLADQLAWTELPCDPHSPAEGRRFVADELERQGAGGAAYTVELVASELIANAVRHARTGVSVGVGVHDGVVHLSVTDEGTGGARVVRPAQDATSGRGLGLVETLASRWGMQEQEPHGTRIWAEFVPTADAQWVRGEVQG